MNGGTRPPARLRAAGRKGPRRPWWRLAWPLLLLFASSPLFARDLSIQERIRAQEAIERVYYSHQIGATLPFEQAVPRAVLERKVRTYLKQTAALEKFWKRPVTGEMLQRELRRMVRQSRMPDRLQELFHALGDDPFLIQECLVRPVLVDRLTRQLFAGDSRFHAPTPGSRAERGRAVLPGSPEGDRPAPPREAPAFSSKGWDEWWDGVEGELDEAAVRATASPAAVLPGLDASSPATAACAGDDTWNNRSLGDPPAARWGHTGVWTGSLMLIWGGKGYDPAVSVGARYDPSADSWTPMSTAGAPAARYEHVAVWTGSRMVVWGGRDPSSVYINTGGIYDPGTDTWTATSVVSAPAAGAYKAVWAGGRMVVLNSSGLGGRYDPAGDVWSPASSSGLAVRSGYSVVSTGDEMIVWGGTGGTGIYYADGARYDPASDTWTPLPLLNAPSPRAYHTAVWSGSEMLIWGGTDALGSPLASGARYDPVSNAWSPISSAGAPALAYHTAVWAGGRMIVWYARKDELSKLGGRYDPVSDTWAPMSTVGSGELYVWGDSALSTGSEMIDWGGVLNGSGTVPVSDPAATGDATFYDTGARYDPSTDTWTPTSAPFEPEARLNHSAVWTGNLMVVWGGQTESSPYQTNDGGRYDPVTDSWTPTSGVGAPHLRFLHSAVWTGTRMIVWGGLYWDQASHVYIPLDTGGSYDPVADTWQDISLTDAPSARYIHTVVWTGDKMIVWGGYDQVGALDTGGVYDPGGDSWTATSMTSAPAARYNHTAVWTGSRMIVWGGTDGSNPLNSGAKYDPAGDGWVPISAVGAPEARSGHTAVWTGDKMIVWGGSGAAMLNSGGRYDPVADAWSPTSTAGAPSARYYHSALWTGDLMVVWGGDDGTETLDTGGRYDPSGDTWSATSSVRVPRRRTDATAIWTGSSILVWGGIDWFPGTESTIYKEFDSGGQYCLCSASIYYPDADGDGFGENSNAIQACAAPVGYVGLSGDCNDADDGAWGIPGEVSGLLFTDDTSFGWSPPADPGANADQYDVIRSDSPSDFVAGGTCVASGQAGLFAADGEVPAPGGLFHYLVRALNACPGGSGPLGNRSDGTPRVALDCP